LRKAIFFKKHFPKMGLRKPNFKASSRCFAKYKGFLLPKPKTNFKREFVFKGKLFQVDSLPCKMDFVSKQNLNLV
jgi:hypothetical protein